MPDDLPRPERTPGAKLLFALLAGVLLAIPLFTVYLLTDDRQSQSRTAQTSIVEGWGDAQVLAGPVLAIPFQDQTTETVQENGHAVQRTALVDRELLLAPERMDLRTDLASTPLKRSIYEAVVYTATTGGTAHFALPADLTRVGVTPERLRYDRAELRFGLSDPRGLVGAPPRVVLGGRAVRLQPGKGLRETGGAGFYAPVDAAAVAAGALDARFDFQARGNASVALVPWAGDTRWRVVSRWPSPSFGGGFLPVERRVDAKGFTATWRVGNLALGRALAEVGDPAAAQPASVTPDATQRASIDLVQPVDLYSEVNRSVKYGFLFIGFTFAAFLLFDVIGGVRVALPEYLLVGAGLILFFVMLLAFAEVIGFTPAYLLAAAAMVGLLTAYSAAVLGSWRRAGLMAGLLAALYAVLYVLLSLEAFSLLIGSVLLFVALAAVMYITRRLDWAGVRAR